jgi:phosphate-selective porin OprO and OprP
VTVRHTIAIITAIAPLWVSQAALAESPRQSADPTAATLEALQRQIDALQAQIDTLKAAAGSQAASIQATDTAGPGTAAATAPVIAASPTWRGAPQFADKDSGFSFKLRGRLNYDIGWVENPGIVSRNFGFSTRVRRARLGVEGTLPGDFAYKAEADFADNNVAWADLLVEYKPGAVSVRVGHFETFQSLEQMSSSRHIMFLERAQMNEAFGHGRRLGGAIGVDSGDWALRAGLFSDTVNSDIDNDEWLFGSRLVYAPRLGDVQLHAGVNYQHREYPSGARNFNYRARNPNRLSDFRLVDTGRFAADGDDVFGVELAAIKGPLYAVAEAQWASVDTLSQDHVFKPTDVPGTENRAAGDPGFSSYYIETGYWLTGETRGYKKGEWDRTKVRNGFDKGGPGAFALAVRYDHLDLSHPAIRSGGIGTGAFRGGKQDLYQLSLVWQPIDYVRVTTAYARAEIEGGPFAATVVPGSVAPLDARDYGQDSIAMRVAFDF